MVHTIMLNSRKLGYLISVLERDIRQTEQFLESSSAVEEFPEHWEETRAILAEKKAMLDKLENA